MGRFQRPTRDGGSSDAAAASGSRDAIIKDTMPRPRPFRPPSSSLWPEVPRSVKRLV